MAGSQILFSLAFLVSLAQTSTELVRKDADKLTKDEINDLRIALRSAYDDMSLKGYSETVGYHGYPFLCLTEGRRRGCCKHGRPTFIMWHRVFIVQVEQALKDKGITIGVPYWDLSRNLRAYPELVRDLYVPDPNYNGGDVENPWYRAEVRVGDEVYHTARSSGEQLFQNLGPGEYTDLFYAIIFSFEFTNYCDFEVHMETVHLALHVLIGGTENEFSLSSGLYAAFDPMFALVHSFMDKIYVIFQELQRLRGLSDLVDLSDCEINDFFTPLEPFNRDENPFPITRNRNAPYETQNHTDFEYSYDNLNLNGLDPQDILELIKERQSRDRVFAVFYQRSIGAGFVLTIKVCADALGVCDEAGHLYRVGSPQSIPWVMTRPTFIEITRAVEKLGVGLSGEGLSLETEALFFNGTRVPDGLIEPPFLVVKPGTGSTYK